VSFFDLSPAVIFTGLVITCIGAGLLVYGKKQRRWPQLAAGFLLVFFPFFMTEALPMIGVAAGVIVLLTWGVRAGL